jgi:hypothetical protein
VAINMHLTQPIILMANTAANIVLTPLITLMVLMGRNTATVHLITPMQLIRPLLLITGSEIDKSRTMHNIKADGTFTCI